MGHGYTELRIRQNRELIARHPRWRHVRAERLRFPAKPPEQGQYRTAVTDAQRHLQRAEELYRRFPAEER